MLTRGNSKRVPRTWRVPIFVRILSINLLGMLLLLAALVDLEDTRERYYPLKVEELEQAAASLAEHASKCLSLEVVGYLMRSDPTLARSLRQSESFAALQASTLDEYDMFRSCWARLFGDGTPIAQISGAGADYTRFRVFDKFARTAVDTVHSQVSPDARGPFLVAAESTLDLLKRRYSQAVDWLIGWPPPESRSDLRDPDLLKEIHLFGARNGSTREDAERSLNTDDGPPSRFEGQDDMKGANPLAPDSIALAPLMRTWENWVHEALVAGTPQTVRRFRRTDDFTMANLTVVWPITGSTFMDPRRQTVGAVELSWGSTRIERFFVEERFDQLLLFLTAIGVSIVLSLLLSGTIVRPIRALAARADDISERRVPFDENAADSFSTLARHRSEIGALATAYRTMVSSISDRIRRSELEASELAHKLSGHLHVIRLAATLLKRRHDRRTPGWRLSGSQQEAVEAALNRVDAAGDLIQRLIKHTFESVDAQRNPRSAFDLEQVVRESLDDRELQAEAADKGVTSSLEIDGDGYGKYRGHPQEIGGVLNALLTNAVSFADNGSAIRVRLARLEEEGQDGSETHSVALSVENDGPHIAEHHMEEIFERWFSTRKDDTASHHGIGLWWTKETANAIGADLKVENCPGDRGETAVRFTVLLP